MDSSQWPGCVKAMLRWLHVQSDRRYYKKPNPKGNRLVGYTFIFLGTFLSLDTLLQPRPYEPIVSFYCWSLFAVIIGIVLTHSK